MALRNSPDTAKDGAGSESRRGPAAPRGQDELLPAAMAALEVGLSLPAFWKAVSAGRLPLPVYPAPRAPRWYRTELHQALAATRARPMDAKAARRNAKLAATR